MIRNKILFSVCFAMLGATAFAQTDLPSEQVEVIKIFEAQLAESEKVEVTPEAPPIDTTIKKQDYQVPAKTFEVEYPAPRIRPVVYKSDEEVPEVYKGYLKLGAGLPKSFYGDGAYNTHVEKGEKSALDIGLNLSHHQADFSDSDVENQRFGLTKAEGKGTYYFDEGYAVGANMGYTSNRVSYYGYSVDKFSNFEDVDKESVKQVFGIFDLGAKIFNGVQTAGDFNYSAGFDFYSMGDSYASGETGFDLKVNATKWIREKHSFDFGVRTDFTVYNDTLSENQTLHNYSLPLAFTYHGGAFKVKLGGKIVSSEDEFYPFPDVEVVVNLTGNRLAFFTGLEGDLQKNTFRSLTAYNPYIHTRLPDGHIRNTKYYNVYAGIRGNLKIFEYTVQAGYKPTNDLALYYFNFDDDLIYDFDIRYDDVNIINIGGSIKASPIKNLTITGTVSQNIYEPLNEARAWHLPAFDANLLAQYTTMDGKLRTKAQLFLQNGVPSNTRGGVNRYDNLGALYDLSVGGEYWFGEHFGAFLDLNNIFNNQRQRWIFYPTYGINVLAGVTARF